jgi:hypothetical protein
MVSLEYKGILDVPTKSHGGATLEEAIREDFGEAGLERFKEYGVQLQVPWTREYEVEFSESGDLEAYDEKNGGSKVIGKVYQIGTENIKSVVAKNANVDLNRNNDYNTLMLGLELNPEQEERQYLRLIFNHGLNKLK